MKISLLNDWLEGGGAERSMVILANHLAEKHQSDIQIHCLEDGVAYPLHARIEHLPIRKRYRSRFHKLISIIPDAIRLSRKSRKSGNDILLSFQFRSNLINVLAKMLRAGHKSVVSERVYANDFYKNQWYGNVAYLLIRFFYNRADRVTCNAEDIKKGLIEIGVKTPIHVINNGYDRDNIRRRATDPPPKEIEHFEEGKKSILSVGRLCIQKGHKYLIQALAKTSNPDDFRLLIVGEGSLKRELENQIAELGLEHVAKIIPFQENPYSFMSACDFMVFPSLYEGYPNVVCESLLIGKPVLGFDFISGAAELITNANGIRVPVFDVEKLAESLDSFEATAFSIDTSMIITAERLCELYEQVFDELA